MNKAGQLEQWVRDGRRLTYQGAFPEEKAKNVRAIMNQHLTFQRYAYRRGRKTLVGLLLAVITGFYFLPTYTFAANPVGLALIGKEGKPQTAWRVWQRTLNACGGNDTAAAMQALGVNEETLHALNNAVIAGKFGDPFTLGFCIKM